MPGVRRPVAGLKREISALGGCNLSKRAQWLNGELKRWVDEGIIDGARADAIRKLYPEPGPATPWAVLVFSGIGAVVAGLGVILLFAYNWQRIPKLGKLAIVFAALATAHGSGIWLHLRSKRFRSLGEGLTVLGTMLFGAGIWLVAQIYHMEEHFPNAFLAWGVGALALGWAMLSVPQAMMAAILFAVWAGVEAAEFHSPMHLTGPMILVLLGPIAYLKRSRVLLAVLIASFAVSMGFASAAYNGQLIPNILMCLATVFLAAGILLRRHGEFPESAPVFHLFGFATYAVLLYLLTFPGLAEHLLEANPTAKLGALLYWLPLVGAMLVAWGAVIWPALPFRKERRLKDFSYDLLLAPLAAMLCQLYALFMGGGEDWITAVPFNLIFLAHALLLLTRGCRKGQLCPTIVGSVMLAALGVARYVDLFQSLVVRGLVFLVVGAGLFFVGIQYARARKGQAETESTS